MACRKRINAVFLSAALFALLAQWLVPAQALFRHGTLSASGLFAPICGDHFGDGFVAIPGAAAQPGTQAADPGDGQRHDPSAEHETCCDLCTAAVHVAIIAHVTLPPHAVGFVAVVFQLAQTPGPAGAAERRYRARDPPVSL